GAFGPILPAHIVGGEALPKSDGPAGHQHASPRLKLDLRCFDRLIGTRSVTARRKESCKPARDDRDHDKQNTRRFHLSPNSNWQRPEGRAPALGRRPATSDPSSPRNTVAAGDAKGASLGRHWATIAGKASKLG